MTSQPNLLELAKQGDAKAFATLLGQKLEPKGISTKASTKNGCLQIMLEATKAPPQKPLVDFIQKALTNLNSGTWQTVKIYGRRTGEDVPDWLEELKVAELPAQNLEELAKQGDVKAITILMHQVLQSQGILAKVSLKGDCLHVMLEAKQAPEQQRMVDILKANILQLEINPIKKVKLYGKQADEDFPEWYQELIPNSLVEASLHVIQSSNVPSKDDKRSNQSLNSEVERKDVVIFSNKLYEVIQVTCYQHLTYKVGSEDDKTIHEIVENFIDDLETELKLDLEHFGHQVKSLSESFEVNLNSEKIQSTIANISFSNFTGVRLSIKQLEKVTQEVLQVNFPKEASGLKSFFTGATDEFTANLFGQTTLSTEAITGAAIGSFIAPGLGTAIGSVLGSWISGSKQQKAIQDIVERYQKAREKVFQEWEILLKTIYEEISTIFKESDSIRLIPYSVFDQIAELCNQGNAYLEQNEFKDAIESYERAIKLNSKFALGWNNKGFALQNIELYDEAIKAYDQALEIDSNFLLALSNKGGLLQKLERHEEALSIFERVIYIAPDNYWVWIDKAISLDNLKRYDDLIETYDRATSIDSSHFIGWYGKAACHAKLSSIEQALENLKKALELDSENCYESIQTDSDFDSIRNDEKFIILMESLVGIDYSTLKALLRNKKWEEADKETASLMCQAVTRQERRLNILSKTASDYSDLNNERISNLPHVDLQTIDQLWQEFSDGKFGFSVQKEIYHSYGGTQEFNGQVRDRFGESTGWRVCDKDVNFSWRRSDQFDYSFATAPRGHLPSCLWAGLEDGWFENRRDRLISLFARMDACSKV